MSSPSLEKSVTEFPNSNEKIVIQNIETMLEKSKIPFTRQKFPRGIKFYGKCDYTRITIHLYNVEDNYPVTQKGDNA